MRWRTRGVGAEATHATGQGDVTLSLQWEGCWVACITELGCPYKSFSKAGAREDLEGAKVWAEEILNVTLNATKEEGE